VLVVRTRWHISKMSSTRRNGRLVARGRSHTVVQCTELLCQGIKEQGRKLFIYIVTMLMGEGHAGPSSSCASAGVHVMGSIQDVEQGSTRVAGIKWMMSRRFAAWTRRQSHESHAGLVTLARYEKSLDGTGECR
jgi:hypothetical protein